MTTYKQFKEYYDTDPTFRENIKLYKTTKVRCDCGKDVSRNNMSTHKRSDAHVKYMEENVDITTNEINKLKDRVTYLEKLLKKVIDDDTNKS